MFEQKILQEYNKNLEMIMSKMLQAVLTTTVLTAAPSALQAKPYCCINPAICKAACGSACCTQRITTAKQSHLTTPILGQVIALR